MAGPNYPVYISMIFSIISILSFTGILPINVLAFTGLFGALLGFVFWMKI